ncbi:hypothetical protein AgCh_023430 [Apium graveolens]
MEQDGQLEKRRKKGGSIVLVAEQEKVKEMKVEAVESAPNSRVYEGNDKGKPDSEKKKFEHVDYKKNHAMVVRDHYGNLVEAKSRCYQGLVSPDLAEAMGIREAQSWVKKENQ